MDAYNTWFNFKYNKILSFLAIGGLHLDTPSGWPEEVFASSVWAEGQPLPVKLATCVAKCDVGLGTAAEKPKQEGTMCPLQIWQRTCAAWFCFCLDWDQSEFKAEMCGHVFCAKWVWRHSWNLASEHWAFCCKVKHAGSECAAEWGFWRWLSD